MMNMFEYYQAIDEQHHDELYELLQIIEIDTVDPEIAAARDKALTRLDELVKLSGPRK